MKIKIKLIKKKLGNENTPNKFQWKHEINNDHHLRDK